MPIRLVVCALIALAAITPSRGQTPLGTAFTYQGRLTSAGIPATGSHDLRFRLYDAASAGAQVGATLCADNISVNAGLFTVPLDFGAQFAGQQRFLEIDVRADTGLDCANATGFITLTPRQPLTPAPNALFASNADRLDGLDSTAFLTGVPVPLTLVGSSPSPIIRGQNTYSGLSENSGVYGISTAASGVGTGVYGQNASLNGYGVHGFASSAGFGIGVYGDTDGDEAVGVYGINQFGSGATTGGYFWVGSTSGRAVFGESFSNTGTTYGVVGRVGSPSGYAGYFEGRGYFSGNVGIGTVSPVATLDVRGNISTTGSITIPVTTRYYSISPQDFIPGDSAFDYSQVAPTGSAFLVGRTIGQVLSFNAPVHLPHGAVVTRFQATVLDTSTANNVGVELDALDQLNGTGTLLTAVTSSGSAGTSVLVSTTIASASIDNNNRAYRVQASWTEPATGEIGVGCVRIDYTVTSSLP